jgi:hypothetical protein
MDAVTPMPKYRCHKEVRALKIASMEWDAAFESGYTLISEEL